MKISWIATDQVHPYENNPRKNTRTVEKLTQSLKEYGWQQPIVVDKENIIIVGHARWQAAQKLGMTQVPVFCATDLTEPQVRSYRLADNRLAEESQWDSKFLSEELAALRDMEVDLSLTGFRETELSQLLGAPEEIVLDPDSIASANGKTVSQPGYLAVRYASCDVW